MSRPAALLLAATLAAVPLASEAKGGHGCGSGHGGSGHSTHGGGHSTTHFSSAPMSTYRAGYVGEDGKYVEPDRSVADCSPDRPCEPSRPSPRR